MNTLISKLDCRVNYNKSKITESHRSLYKESSYPSQSRVKELGEDAREVKSKVSPKDGIIHLRKGNDGIAETSEKMVSSENFKL